MTNDHPERALESIDAATNLLYCCRIAVVDFTSSEPDSELFQAAEQMLAGIWKDSSNQGRILYLRFNDYELEVRVQPWKGEHDV